jgi:protoporphyrinogen oxidase
MIGKSKICLDLKYIVFEREGFRTPPDEKVPELARREIVELGLVRPEEIEDGTVVRMPKAYLMYDMGWTEQVAIIRSYLEENLVNLQLVSRNGMHKYNNQDHSMMTGLCAARNILGAKHDLWATNTGPDYQEEQQGR